MSLLTNLLVGRSGLSAAQAGVDATSQNVANASVPGATRRMALTSVNSPLRRGNLWLGQGASVDGIDRPSDNLLTARRLQGLGTAARSELSWQALRSAETVFDATQATTSRAGVDAFFDSLTRATADPSDPGLRRGVMSAARDLATSVSREAGVLNATLTGREETIEASLPKINDALRTIADLNRAILASDNGTLTSGDIKDQRDAQLQVVAIAAGAQVHLEADGTATVFLSGHAAVSGIEARSLSYSETAEGAPQVSLSHSGNTSLEITDGLGGEIGGQMDAWNTARGWLDRLDTFAADFSAAVNTAHAAGFDRTGVPGEPIFVALATDPALSLTINAGLVEDPSKLAFAGTSPPDAGDIDNLRSLLNLEVATTIDGSTTAGAWLTDLVTTVGTDVSRLESETITNSALARDLEELHQNLHGIDLDEEAANLILYQAAYQASARVIAANDALVNTLLELV
ncbi:MAG: flagellar hook-associated protein FlgK [Myxococcota bacterium]